uniref:Uncharacterized protein n=1 Tax=Ficus carica TaxID=3494 RepID=A0AA88EIL2_FICCA|nr:hypothetical protein TIFTF001_054651 [Ficus carica]
MERKGKTIPLSTPKSLCLVEKFGPEWPFPIPTESPFPHFGGKAIHPKTVHPNQKAKKASFVIRDPTKVNVETPPPELASIAFRRHRRSSPECFNFNFPSLYMIE